MGVRVEGVDYNILNTKTRMPFRFGIVTMTAAPHLFLTAHVNVDGVAAKGIAAEGLLPKWFTKDPGAAFRDEIADMLGVIRSACDIAVETGGSNSVFELWKKVYDRQKSACEARGIPGLLWGFGVSMIERALIDGFCRAKGITLQRALKENALGIVLPEVYPELGRAEVSDFLDLEGSQDMYARHTVGMTDTLRESEIKPEDAVHDGLPQSLDECIRTYGLSRFKIKLSGDIAKDSARLMEISRIIAEQGIGDWAFTLDGNENFAEAGGFAGFWDELASRRELKDFLRRLIFVEQPVKRTNALADATKDVFLHWANKPPMIIDESDSEIGSLTRALDCGYEGTSHKNCKGVIKGIANACVLRRRAMEDPAGTYLLSGEDLVNIGPVALLQDLTAACLLGIGHIERNGHHYFRGLSMFPGDVQASVISAHPDLYRAHPEGFAALDIAGGKLRVQSLLKAPFGYGFSLDPGIFTPAGEWTYESLEGQ